MKLRVGGILDMSTVDYPGKVSSVIFLHGCNFRCPFCYNTKLVEGDEYTEMSVDGIMRELKEDSDFIDAVCITGGEPTLQFDGLLELCRSIKSAGKLVKLDTNGYLPEKLGKILDEKVVDFVSMDIKAPPVKYSKMSGIEPDLSRIERSIGLLKDSGVNYELRTTLVMDYNDTEDDLSGICDFIGIPMSYVLQQFRGSEGTLDKSLSSLPKTDRQKLIRLAGLVRKRGINVKIRTEEEGEETV